MSTLSDDARSFLGSYAEAYDRTVDLANLAGELVSFILSDRDYGLHLISSRAKSVDSLRMKIVRKNYADPASEVTDQIGVRVITYYGEKVDSVVSRLSTALRVDYANSLDKRQQLAESERFGYRSVHLVCVPTRETLRDGRWSGLRARVIEIQIRSLLDHVWAEIEHELSYKSGIQHSVSFRRRFSAMAGTLEILESEFLQLRNRLDEITDSHRAAYLARRERTIELDASRLTALLEVLCPYASGWRHRELVGAPLPISASTCVQALNSVGVSTAREFERVFRLRRCQRLVEAYASNSGLAADEVSHLVVAALVVGNRDRAALRDFFWSLSAEVAFLQVFGGAEAQAS